VVSRSHRSLIIHDYTCLRTHTWQDANMSGTGDHVVLVGAASKGIIQRDFQHHAMVYRWVHSFMVTGAHPTHFEINSL